MNNNIRIKLLITWLEESLSFAVKNGTKQDRRELQEQLDQLKEIKWENGLERNQNTQEKDK